MSRRMLIGVFLAVVVLMSMVSHAPIQAQDDFALKIHKLAQMLHEDNIENQNLTFWVGGTLGVEDFELEHINPGDPIPQFFFAPLFKGEKELDSADLKPPYLLNFWASWCTPCQIEFPVLQKAIKDDQFGIVMYFVNVLDEEKEAVSFATTYRKNLRFVLDFENVFVMKHMLPAIPQTWLIGEDGIVKVIHLGNVTEKGAAFLEAVIKHPGVGGFNRDIPDRVPTIQPTARATTTRSK